MSSANPLTISRHEDRRLITGQGKFTADWNFPGQLHAAMVRSDHAHARIVSLDLSAARSAPGVVVVLTAEDVAAAGFDTLPSGPPLKGAGDSPHLKAPMPVLAADKVLFVGQPIAMIIAESALMARDAAEQVAIEYEELPAVTSIAAARAAGAPQLHEAAPGNCAITFESGDRAAVEAAFAKAAKTSRVRIDSQRLSGAPMELRACVSVHDPARNVTVVHTPTQGMLGMRGTLAAVTRWPATEIEVVAKDVGGSFGLRGGTASEQVLTMLAARKLGRPVKWVSSRSELFMSEWHGRALVLNGSVALDADDRVLAIRFDDEVDLGAFSAYFGSFIGTRNIAVTMGGVYRVPALYMQSRLYYTNTVPVSAYRGAGRPDIAWAIERLMDQAAVDHRLDPAAFRRKNFIAPTQFPYKTANGTEYDCGEFDRVMTRALALADYAGFPARRDAAKARGRLRGIGFACYLEASGGGAGSDQVSCTFSRDGRLTLFGMTGPSGQGHETSFAQIAANALGLTLADITYRASEPDSRLVGNGTGGSRSLYGAGSAFKNLVDALVVKAGPLAAKALGVDEGSLRFADGRFAGAGGASITFTDLARRLGESAGDGAHPLDTAADAQSGVTFPNGCHVIELEVDPETGTTSVIGYVAVDDLGNVISPQLVAGQVHGGVVQGLGQAFGEQIVYDAGNGQLMTGSFMDYMMPRAGLLPAITSVQVAVPTKLNALGAKGVGESGCSGSLPAVSNAMAQALRAGGAQPIDMPYTPARVWQALQAGA